MCGRYALNVQARILEEQFRALCKVEFGPRYNVAPSTPVVIVRDTEAGQQREIVMARQYGSAVQNSLNLLILSRRNSATNHRTSQAPQALIGPCGLGTVVHCKLPIPPEGVSIRQA